MINITHRVPPERTTDEAHKAGIDCAINGPNTANCHFAFFTSPEKTTSWEQGREEGEDLIRTCI
jgi:hypothetical protein